ncbi:SRPBCC family protein [Mycobacteroides abscessus]
MRTAQLIVDSSSHPDEAYRAIAQFEEYPQYVEDISSITVRQDDPSALVPETTYSDWEVIFRNGLLRWTEVDYHNPADRSIAFEQLSGDFEIFRGRWLVEPSPTGSRVSFEVTFDFGIPSLAGVLEPIAERVLKESIFTIMSRTIADVTPVIEESRALAAEAVAVH